MSTIVGNETMGSLWEWLALNRADHEFLVFEERAGRIQNFTYAQFDALVSQTANLLLSWGVSSGHRVAIVLRSSPEYLMIILACAKIGAAAVPVNVASTPAECRQLLRGCEVQAIVLEPDCQSRFLAMRAEEGGLFGRSVTIAVAHAHGQALCEDVIDFDAQRALQSGVLAGQFEVDSMDDALILFTSGTTSCPKGVQLTHANMLYSGYYGDWQCGLAAEDRLLSTMPAFHSNFQTAAFMPVLTAGATLVWVEKYSAHRYWEQVRAHKATSLQLMSMMVRTMMLQPESPDEANHCVRSTQYYLPISSDEKDAFEKRFNVRLQNCYGLTESVCWVTTDLPYGERRWPSVGRAGLGYEVEVLAEDGQPAAPGVVGDIVVHGEPGLTLMKGYCNEPEATARALDGDGWLHTGDRGYRDADGWLYFVDRACNVIKRSGENVSASEVEDVISMLPEVAECAVIGVDDPIRDQAVKALVVPKAGCSLSADDILSHCNLYLSSFKVPSFVELCEALPHTSTGKVAKKLLK